MLLSLGQSPCHSYRPLPCCPLSPIAYEIHVFMYESKASLSVSASDGRGASHSSRARTPLQRVLIHTSSHELRQAARPQPCDCISSRAGHGCRTGHHTSPALPRAVRYPLSNAYLVPACWPRQAGTHAHPGFRGALASWVGSWVCGLGCGAARLFQKKHPSPHVEAASAIAVYGTDDCSSIVMRAAPRGCRPVFQRPRGRHTRRWLVAWLHRSYIASRCVV